MKKFLTVLTLAAVASSFSTVGFAKMDTKNDRPKLPSVRRPLFEQKKGVDGRRTGGAADVKKDKKAKKDEKKETKTEKKLIKKMSPGKSETKTETKTKTTNKAD